MILPVGLGALDDAGFTRVGETIDRKVRAQLLNEGLAILAGLWSGRPFSFSGEHYQIQEMTFLPPPVQSPRIPIWVVGGWPRMKSMRRVLHWDGLLPNKLNEDGTLAEITPDDIREMKSFIDEQRTATTPFDIVWEGRTPGDDGERAAAIVRRGKRQGLHGGWKPCGLPQTGLTMCARVSGRDLRVLHRIG